MQDTGQPGSPERPPRTEGKSRNEARAWLIVVLLALVVGYVIWFAIDNTNTVPVGWGFGTTRSRLIWVILVSLILGALVGLLALWLGGRRRRRADRSDR